MERARAKRTCNIGKHVAGLTTVRSEAGEPHQSLVSQSKLDFSHALSMFGHSNPCFWCL